MCEDAYRYMYNGKQCGDRVDILTQQNEALQYHGLSEKGVAGCGEGLTCSLNMQNMFLLHTLDNL